MLLAIWLLDRFLKYLQFYFQSVLHKSKTLFFKDFERWAQARSRRLINIARLTNVGPNLINPGPRPNTEPSENRRRQPRGLLFPSVVQRLPPNLPLPTLILPLSDRIPISSSPSCRSKARSVPDLPTSRHVSALSSAPSS